MQLIPIQSCIGKKLRWAKSEAAPRRYELTCGEKAAASLQWARLTGSLATYETTDGRWTFKRTGFFSARITVRAEGSEIDTAIFQPGGWGTSGTLAIVGGPAYVWRSHGFWRASYEFQDAMGASVIEIAPPTGVFGRSAEVTIHACAAHAEHAALLPGLAWYLVMMAEEDSAAIAACTAVFTAAAAS